MSGVALTKERLDAAHTRLIDEYISVWEYLLRAPQDSATPALFKAMLDEDELKRAPRDTGRAFVQALVRRQVGRHIARRLDELGRAYVRLAQRMPEADARRSWLITATESLEVLKPAFATKSPFAAVRASVATALSLAGTFGLAKLAAKGVSGASQYRIVVLTIIGLVLELGIISVTWLVAAFRIKRSVLLGQDSERVSEKDRDLYRGGANVYRLEDELFDLLGSGRRVETQLDVFAWGVATPGLAAIGWVLFFLGGISYTRGSTMQEYFGLAFFGAALVAFFCWCFVVRKARKRRWGTRDAGFELERANEVREAPPEAAAVGPDQPESLRAARG